MIKDFRNRVAVITGGAGGLGLAFTIAAAQRAMKIVLADIQPDALRHAQSQLENLGAEVLAVPCDVRKAEQVQALAQATMDRFGAVHLLLNNAGVGSGGLVWENSVADWEWVLGVNLWGAIHGVRVFTPLMLECAKRDTTYQGHIVNTASIAGLVNAPALGTYNVSKHALVALSETLYHDLKLIEAPIGASVLCPYFVPTGIADSERNRPEDVRSDILPTPSQLIAQILTEKAVTSGKISPSEIAELTFSAIEDDRFYIYSDRQPLESVRARMDDILLERPPSNPYAALPQVTAMLQGALNVK